MDPFSREAIIEAHLAEIHRLDRLIEACRGLVGADHALADLESRRASWCDDLARWEDPVSLESGVSDRH